VITEKVQKEIDAINFEKYNDEQLLRKEDQHWDMAGLARQDRDQVDADRHTTLARAYQRARHERKL